MVAVKKEGVILRRTTLSFEDEAVLNPATFQDGNTVHMFYRAVRKGNHSTVGYCKMEGPTTVVQRNGMPLLSPQFDYEVHGIEDPRIVKIDDLYYLTFAVYDGMNALGGLATSKDLVNFERKGLIVPKENAREAAMVNNLKVYGVGHINEVISFFIITKCSKGKSKARNKKRKKFININLLFSIGSNSFAEISYIKSVMNIGCKK